MKDKMRDILDRHLEGCVVTHIDTVPPKPIQSERGLRDFTEGKMNIIYRRIELPKGEPHTCPTCDGYGYLVRVAHRRFFSYHKVEDCSEVEDIYDVPGMVPRLVDIPCPKCESDAP